MAEETKKEEKKVTPKVEKKEAPKKEEAPKSDVIGEISGGKKVHQKIGTVKFKRITWPVPKSELPQEIQTWLTNKGYGTNIYLKDKEWLENHHVDMEMIEKLKKFISDKYL